MKDAPIATAMLLGLYAVHTIKEYAILVVLGIAIIEIVIAGKGSNEKTNFN